MSALNTHIESIEKLLASITLEMGSDGFKSSFLFGPPGAQPGEKLIGVEVYYHFLDLNLAALYVRSVGPRYLKALSLDEICSRLQYFISDNFGYIGHLTFGPKDERPLNLWVPDKEKRDLANALAASAIFRPTMELTVFPLDTVVVERKPKFEQFFFSSPKNKDAFFLNDQRLSRHLDTKVFPPNTD